MRRPAYQYRDIKSTHHSGHEGGRKKSERLRASGASGSGRGRGQPPADGNGGGIAERSKIYSDPGEYFRNQNPGPGNGDDQRSGCGQYGRGDGCHAGGGSHICRRICPKDRSRGSDYRCGGYCDGWQGGFCHKQRPSHDEQGNRYRLYAVRHDDGLSYGKS